MNHNFSFKRALGATLAVFVGAFSFSLVADFDCSSSVAVYTTQQSPIDGDAAYGFGWFREGFVLPADSGTFTVKLAVPVAGTIDLCAEGSTLLLASDMTLASGATIVNSGTVAGGGFTLSLTDDLIYTGVGKTLTVSDDLIIDGGHHMFTIGGSNAIAIEANKTLTLRNMTLLLTTSATAFSLAGTSTLLLENVRLVLTNDYTFSDGFLTIKGKTTFSSNPGFVFTYSSEQALTICAQSELHLDYGFTLRHNHPTDGGILLTDRTAWLRLTGATLESAARALTLEFGTLISDHASNLATSGEDGALVLGDNTNRLYVVLWPAATFAISGNVTCANAS